MTRDDEIAEEIKLEKKRLELKEAEHSLREKELDAEKQRIAIMRFEVMSQSNAVAHDSGLRHPFTEAELRHASGSGAKHPHDVTAGVKQKVEEKPKAVGGDGNVVHMLANNKEQE